MPTETTVGRLMLEDAVPADVRGHVGVLDKKGIARLGEALAAKGPDAYRDAMARLTRVAGRAGYESGGYSFGPEDLVPGPQTRAAREELRAQIRAVLANPAYDAKTRDAELVRLGLEAMQPLLDVSLAEHRAAKNPLALQIDSGAKGKAENLRALVVGDVLYTDQNYRPIPYVIEHSFAEGLRPHEYTASTFGARQAIGLTKLGTAQGGWLAKRLGNLAHRLVVTAPDGPPPAPDHPPVGLPVDTADPGNENAFLAHPAGGYGRNTHLTRDVLADLRRRGVERILVRSPLVGGPADGGVYGYDVGVRERNRIAPVGDHVGRAAADSVSEPVTQTIIGSKHGGGVAGQSSVQQGFPVIERLFSVPAVYPGGVTHAQRDGIVTAVRPAPQGGHYVVVDGEEHYVHPDRTPTARVGDRVEAGDPLSDGVKNPAELVRHKGVGEARRQFVDEFLRVGRANGVHADRRNVELVARGFIDHVHVDRELGEYAPGEIAPYTAVAAAYEPRAGHRTEKPAHAVGGYLERPALHYTIGTRVTPGVARVLDAHGVSAVVVHSEPPPFTPTLVRANDTLAHDRDWGTQMLGSGLEKSLLRSVARGAVMDPYGTSFVPALMAGTEFGVRGKTKGWDPAASAGAAKLGG